MLGISDRSLGFRKKTVYLYSFLLASIFLWKLPIFFEVSYCSDIRVALFPILCSLLSLCVAILLLTRSELQLDKFKLPVCLLAAAFVWIFLRFMMSRFLFENPDITLIFSRAFLAFFLIFPAAFVLDPDERRICLSFVTASWVFVMTVMTLIAVICAFTCSVLCVFNGSAVGITIEYYNRMSFPLYPTISAQNACTAGALAIFGLLSVKKKSVRLLYALCIPVLFTACALTDSRTSILSFSLLFAFLLFTIITSLMKTHKAAGLFCASGVFLVVIVVLYLVSIQLYSSLSISATNVIKLQDLYNSQTISSQLDDIPVATVLKAEDINTFAPIHLNQLSAFDKTTEHRQIEFTFTGRTTAWKTALSALAENRENVLLVGATPYLYHKTIGLSENFAHMHNIYLQTLVEFGLPGFIILVSFLVLFIISAVRLIFDDSLSLAQRFVPVPAIAILFTELMESFCQLRGDNVSLYILMLFMGLTFAADTTHKKQSDK